MTATYRIRPLVWESGGSQELSAYPSPGVMYSVWTKGGCSWWEESFRVLPTKADTLAAAKLAAESHWHQRLSAALEEVKGGNFEAYERGPVQRDNNPDNLRRCLGCKESQQCGPQFICKACGLLQRQYKTKVSP